MSSPPSAAGRRVFLALALPAELRAALADSLRAELGSVAGLRLTPAANLHLTLCFLGRVEAPLEDALRSALAPAIAREPELQLELGSAGAFPRRGRERVLWIGVQEEPHPETLAQGRLAGLASAVREAALEAGWRAESQADKPWQAHVTVGRVGERARSGSGLDGFYSARYAGSWRARSVELVESQLTPDGARYRTLESFPLGT